MSIAAVIRAQQKPPSEPLARAVQSFFLLHAEAKSHVEIRALPRPRRRSCGCRNLIRKTTPRTLPPRALHQLYAVPPEIHPALMLRLAARLAARQEAVLLVIRVRQIRVVVPELMLLLLLLLLLLARRSRTGIGLRLCRLCRPEASSAPSRSSSDKHQSITRTKRLEEIIPASPEASG